MARSKALEKFKQFINRNPSTRVDSLIPNQNYDDFSLVRPDRIRGIETESIIWDELRSVVGDPFKYEGYITTGISITPAYTSTSSAFGDLWESSTTSNFTSAEDSLMSEIANQIRDDIDREILDEIDRKIELSVKEGPKTFEEMDDEYSVYGVDRVTPAANNSWLLMIEGRDVKLSKQHCCLIGNEIAIPDWLALEKGFEL